MMKIVTSATVWNDAIGKRISVTYSEVDEETGRIVSDNNRVDRVVTAAEAKSLIDGILEYAESII